MRRVWCAVLLAFVAAVHLGPAVEVRAVAHIPTSVGLLPVETHGALAAQLVLSNAGLTMPAAELPTSWQRALVFDIDADGDEDFVANVGSVNLGVWLNDGSGHLSRAQASVSPTQWAPEPPTPSYDHQVPSLVALSPDQHQLARLAPARAAPVVVSVDATDTPSVGFDSDDSSAPSSPRAPPLV